MSRKTMSRKTMSRKTMSRKTMRRKTMRRKSMRRNGGGNQNSPVKLAFNPDAPAFVPSWAKEMNAKANMNANAKANAKANANQLLKNASTAHMNNANMMNKNKNGILSFLGL